MRVMVYTSAQAGAVGFVPFVSTPLIDSGDQLGEDLAVTGVTVGLPCPDQCGTLTVEQEGPHLKLTIDYPDGYQHAFTAEYWVGKDPDTGDDVWNDVKFNGHRFAFGDVGVDLEAPSNRTYRALVYDRLDDGRLHTNGNYTPAAGAH